MARGIEATEKEEEQPQGYNGGIDRITLSEIDDGGE